MRTRTRWLLTVAAILAAFNALLWSDEAIAALPSFVPGAFTLGNLLYGLLFAVFVGGAVAWLLWWILGKWLRVDIDKSCWKRPAGRRPKYGFPACWVGIAERFMFTIVVALEIGDVLTAMMAWLALKLAASWEPNLKNRNSVRSQVGAFRALIVGLVSLLFAAMGGKIALGVWW